MYLRVDEVPGAPDHQVVGGQDPLESIWVIIKYLHRHLGEAVNVLVVIQIIHAGHTDLKQRL